MSVAAESAIRAWINARDDLTGDGHVLSRGAYLREQRSPADGAYAVVTRQSEGVSNIVAEDGAVSMARVQCLVYSGTEESAEVAAAALRTAIESLSGLPEPCGTTGVTVLVSDNLLGPFLVPHVGDTGEQYCFQVNADFMLTE